MSATTTITLPGPPVAYAVEPARLDAYLRREKWSGPVHPASEPVLRFWRWVDSRQFNAYVPLREHETPKLILRATMREIARYEGRHHSEVIADVMGRPAGPALQWAHASADARAPVLALLDSEAADSRHNAAVAREEGKTAEALSEDGRAMAHEAAAAALRASR